MRIVHLADLHLGFRQFPRMTPAGMNQREADVAQAFSRAVTKIIELKPDAIVVAGDIFHNPRPSNASIIFAFQELGRLAAALPDADTIMVAGNHDAPRTLESGGILPLFRNCGVHIIDKGAERLLLKGGQLEVLCVPESFGIVRPEMVPVSNAPYRVLLLHGEVAGVIPNVSVAQAMNEIQPTDLHPDEWSYVALGHYHQYQNVGKNAFYSGSLDYVSTSFWSERAPKGFVEHNLATGEHTFHQVETPRQVVDLAPVGAHGLTAEQLNIAVREAVESFPGGIEGKIVRLLVRDVPRGMLRDLDHKMIRDFKKSAFHFQLDARNPELLRPTESFGVRSAKRRATLEQTVRNFIEERATAPGVDKNSLANLALKYLADATSEAPVEAPSEAAA